MSNAVNVRTEKRVSVEQSISQSIALMKAGDLDKASLICDAIILLQPSSTLALRQQYRIAARRSDTSDFEKLLPKLIDHAPDLAMSACKLLFRAKRYEVVAQSLIQMNASLRTKEVEDLSLLVAKRLVSIARVMATDIEEPLTATYLGLAIHLAPTLSEPRTILARFIAPTVRSAQQALRAGDTQAARTHYLAVLSADPDHVVSRRTLALMLSRVDLLDEANTHFEILWSGGHRDVIKSAISCARKTKDTMLVLQWLERLAGHDGAEFDGSDHIVKIAIPIARSAMASGDAVNAVRALLLVNKVSPSHATVSRLLASARAALVHSLGACLAGTDRAEGVVRAKQAVKTDPDYPPLLKIAARIFVGAGAFKEASACYASLVSQEPDSGELVARLAVVALQAGDATIAKEASERALRRTPDDVRMQRVSSRADALLKNRS